MRVSYKNWKGKTRTRKINPLNIWHGKTTYHKEPQWLLTAVDTEDGKTKDFALKDCNFRTVPKLKTVTKTQKHD